MPGKRKAFFSIDSLKRLGHDLFLDALGSFFFAIGIYNFAAPANFAPGGVTGISIIINHFTKLPIGSLAFILNIPLILLSLRILGKDFLFRSLRTLAVNTLFLDLVSPQLPVYRGDPLLAALFAGALAGIGLAIIYQNKSSTGGSDLIIMSLRKRRPHMSLGQITLFVDGIIILAGGLVFKQIDALLYGFIYSATMILLIDKIMFGVVSGKLAMIISDHGEDIAKQIGRELERGATILQAEGAYSKEHRPMVMCACSRSQVPQVRKIVHQLDPHALMIVTSYDEVYGEGFLPIGD